MSCTHDCGCSAETRDARTDDWGHTSPLSPQNADLREFQPAEPSQPLGTTRDQAARDAETDIWPTKKRVLLAAAIKAADGMGLTSSLLARPAPSEPADASEALRDVPPAERPSEALPRPIEPEDVRVGMLVERRNGECYVGGRVESIDGSGIWLGKIAIAWIFGAKYAERGWSLWLIEDAPAPVDPDAELVERMATAIDAEPGFNVSDMAHAALAALRETHNVTPRSEQ